MSLTGTVCEVIDLATLNQLEDKLRAADEAIKASLTAKIDAIPQDDDYDYGYDYDDYSNSGCNRCTERVDHNAIPVSCKRKLIALWQSCDSIIDVMRVIKNFFSVRNNQ